MRLIKLFISVIFLFGIAFSANAVTIKWLGLMQDDSAHKADIDAAIADWEAKTVNKVNAGTKKIIIVEYFSTNADVMFFFII